MRIMQVERIIFFGTPDFAVPALRELHQNYKVVQVITQPDQPAGRGKKLKSPPVKIYCDENKILYSQPPTIKGESFLREMHDLKPDVMIVAAYGKIFPQSLLSHFPMVLNIHASLLPRWRGASPISQSILTGDHETGISIMKIVKELDAGPVMLQKSIDIEDDDDTDTLTKKLSELGSESLMEALDDIKNDRFEFVEQNEKEVTFAPMLAVEDAKLNWENRACHIQRHIRAYAPMPGAFTYDSSERIKIFRSRLTNQEAREKPGSIVRQKKQLFVACGDEWIEILEVQRQAKNRQGITDFLNGYPMERMKWN